MNNTPIIKIFAYLCAKLQTLALMRKLFCILTSIIIGLYTCAQTPDERIGAMINNAQWFELRQFYESNTEPVSPFLDKFAKAMLAHFFNKHNEAVTYGGDLLNNHGSEMGLGNVISVGSLMCDNLSAQGENEQAASALQSIIFQVSEYLDSATVARLRSRIALYKAQAPYKMNDVLPFENVATVKFRLDSIGAPGKRSVLMALENSAINGHSCSPVFDTGAGVNVISEDLAAEMGLEIFDIDVSAAGKGTQSAKFAIAKEMQLGELTIRNVPFYVMTMQSGHNEADQYMSLFQLVVGRQVMEAVKYLTLDFTRKEIIITPQSVVPRSAMPNLCISQTGVYLLQCHIDGNHQAVVIPDTGGASFGSLELSRCPYLSELIPAGKTPETIRTAGAGGYTELSGVYLFNLPIAIGDATVTIPRISLLLQDDPSGTGNYMGIETIELFKVLSFDLERMILYPQ